LALNDFIINVCVTDPLVSVPLNFIRPSRIGLLTLDMTWLDHIGWVATMIQSLATSKLSWRSS